MHIYCILPTQYRLRAIFPDAARAFTIVLIFSGRLKFSHIESVPLYSILLIQMAELSSIKDIRAKARALGILGFIIGVIVTIV